MKILQVCPYDYSRPGGVKTHIENLSENLRQKGHEVEVIAPNINTDKVTERNINFFGTNESLNIGGTKIDINIALKDERKLMKAFLDSNKFDIIHYHTIWNPLVPFQIRYYSSAKNVATFHDTPADSFIGQKIVGKFLMPAMSSIISKYLDGIISVSESQSKYINKYTSKKPIIIPNGINPEFVSQGSPISEYKDGKFNLLFLGRFEERKGLMYALKAFKELKVKYNNMRLIIAGDGNGRIEGENFIIANNLPDVEFLGFVDEKTKLDLLKTADIYLAPAIYGESFGIVLLEAMACGLPMVGFGNEGYMNIIQGEWAQFFPKPKDLKTFIEQIDILYNQSDKREAMKAWGLNEVHKYSWHSVTDRIAKIYDQALR
jgi:phosphatidylinositol alpha-mannosyltransferase